MQAAWMQRSGRIAVGAALLVAMTGRVLAGDDDSGSGLLGRIFRFGNNGSSSSSNATPGAPAAQPGAMSSPALPYGSVYGNTLPAGGSTTPSSGRSSTPLSSSYGSSFGGAPETPALPSDNSAGQRLTPRSRVTSAVTSADPILTRFALGKSNDGSSFGMFLQVFADGTVVDSEGVHHVRPADLKPIVETIQSGEVYHVRGHCGAPSTDFVEYVHIVVYERRFNRLQAHSFSYSGNPQGCDHVIKHLHQALENLQARISRTAGSESAAAPAPAASPAPAPMAASANPASPAGYGSYSMHPASSAPAGSVRQPALPATTPGGPVIPLTPADSNR